MADATSNLSVCFFSHSSRLDGAERSLLQLITELIREHRVKVTVVLPGDGPLIEKLEQVGAATLRVDYSWWCDASPPRSEEIHAVLSNSFEAILGTVLRELTEINPDIVLTNTMVIPWGAVTASLLNKPHVWYVREFGELDHDLKFFRPFQEILNIITDSSNLILTNSKAVGNALFGESSDLKIVAVYNNIEIPIDAVAEEPQGQYFTRPNATKLIITGGIAKRKGQAEAIRAVKELIDRKREVELIIMGVATPYLNDLQTMVSEQGLEDYVKFLDFRENPYPVVNQTDVVLVCSSTEAFGRVTVEAMLLKKPVIGTNAGGTIELVREGYNGLFYESGDYGQLADKIEYLMDRPQKIREFGENGFKFAMRSFTSKEYGSKVYDLLMGIKDNSNPLSSNYFDFLKQSLLALRDMWEQEKQLSVGKLEQEQFTQEQLKLQTQTQEFALKEEVAQLQTSLRLRYQEFEQQQQDVAQLQAKVQAQHDELTQQEEEVAQLHARVDAQSRELAPKEEELAQHRAMLTTLSLETVEQQATLRAQQQALVGIEDEKARLQALVGDLKMEITTVKGSLGWLISDRYRRAKDKSRLLSFINSALVMPIKRRAKGPGSHPQEKTD